MLCVPYYACVFSSTKLVTRAEQDLPGAEGRGGEKVREGAGGRNDPNKVCTRGQMNNLKKKVQSANIQ
jgi:hypothetical protein